MNTKQGGQGRSMKGQETAAFWEVTAARHLVSASWDGWAECIRVLFNGGQVYEVPIGVLREVRGDPGRRVILAQVDDLGSGVEVFFADGTHTDLSWDFILFHVEPRYRAQVELRKPPPAPRAIGQRIRKLREARGWTAQRLADETRIAQPNIIRLEQGKHEPRTSTLARIAEALGLDISDILQTGHAGPCM